jgi:hypothetical protein
MIAKNLNRDEMSAIITTKRFRSSRFRKRYVYSNCHDAVEIKNTLQTVQKSIVHHYVRGLEIWCTNSMNWNNCIKQTQSFWKTTGWKITDKAHTFHNQTMKIEFGIRGWCWPECINFHLYSIRWRPLSITDSSLDFVDEPNDSGGRTRYGDDWSQRRHSRSSPQTSYQTA